MRLSMRCAVVLVLGCATPKPAAQPPPAAPAPQAVVLEGLGPYQRPVTGATPEAQRWFDQGLNVLFAFNQDEAIRAFAEAARLSPGCAMAHWGIAYANGPHINNAEVDADHAAAAWAALARAQGAAAAASPVEQALIAALAHRYANPQPKDRAPLEAAYADAMREVQRKFPGDADVAALTAEALMDVHPWDYWREDGSAQPWTWEILRTLSGGLRLEPKHPMLHHLQIHAVEASQHPEAGVASAEILGGLQPGLGHMVHMPSHIFVRTGQWAKAMESNQRAIAQDEAYRARVPKQGFYSLYMMHNHQMLAYAAMMSGRGAVALQAARDLVGQIPPEFRKEAAALVDPYYAMPLEVMMRFGKWDEILAAPDFAADLPTSRALRHAARAIAHAARDDVAHAREEQALFTAAEAKVPREAIFGLNTSPAVLEVAARLVDGELLYRTGKAEEGFAELRKAVAAEDRLKYDEPPEWLQPVRHALGAALAQSGRFAEAEEVFREDLRRVPKNGWGLFGLSRALRQQGKAGEAGRIEAQFDAVWQGADVQLKSACFCQQGI